MFLVLIKKLIYNFHIWLICLFNLDQNIVQIYNDKDVKLFSKNLIDIALETGQSVRESKRHDLILKMGILGTKGTLLFVTFLNPHSIIDASEIQLGKRLGPA